jgi:Adenylate and Guanylate cyclase catalytic domain
MSARSSVDSWRQAVLDEERRGEQLAAFDLAERGLEQHPDDLWLKHRAVLALARAGATDEAARRLGEYGLADIADEDVAALRARIAKDVALASGGVRRRRLAGRAADLYGAIFARTGGYYPAINAATLRLLAGEAGLARELARVALERVAESGEESYYAAATEGEAHLLRGDEDAASEALERAAERHGGDYGALASTRRQLRLVCELVGADLQLLSVLAGPAVVHFCGHLIAGEGQRGGFPAETVTSVTATISEQVKRHRAGFAYGSLAGGADILWAEALLDAGSELHVVLPFAHDEFIARSVAPAGPEWVLRFQRCVQAATSIRYATDDAFLGDDVLFRYGSELAMGLALLRARYLDADARQLAVWDGEAAAGAAGTGLDVATWRHAGHPVSVVAPGGETVELGPDRSPHVAAQRSRAEHPSADSDVHRVVCAMLFGDIKGFSKLTDEQLPRFATHILGAFAAVLDRHSEEVWHRNTWGDAVYVVLSGAPAAAACALDLQDAMATVDLQSRALPAHLALRLGGHLGPVFPTRDPVLQQLGFMGSHVSRTARIEPVTPPAAVYVTEPFAAALMLQGEHDFACDYVGHMPAAKDYGRLRMYRLRRTRRSSSPPTELLAGARDRSAQGSPARQSRRLNARRRSR